MATSCAVVLGTKGHIDKCQSIAKIPLILQSFHSNELSTQREFGVLFLSDLAVVGNVAVTEANVHGRKKIV